MNPLLPFTDFDKFRHKSFSRLWGTLGIKMSKDMPPGTAEAVSSVSGVVLDLGPGSGEQLHLYDPKKITKMYGIEPAVDMHKALSTNAAQNGFKGDRYEIITAGAEPSSLVPALAKKGLLDPRQSSGEGTFDTVSCIRVLCGVPDLEETVEGIYRLLKPGGRLVLAEHVVNPYPNGGSVIGRNLQRFYTFMGWTFFLGGCCLERDTAKVLKDVARRDGGWKSFDVKTVDDWSAVPTVVGVLVKK